ncbi:MULTISPECIES: SpaH/EbpB family LPXTG-anchored major pilin [unclassified Corynebacterium]|uniref:SpaH/EbpB family LPXTG-anchored major pilin n=1 Tax=unclassified Corynebacterium TaxID=2624378 RepID=UPI0034CE6687
MTSLNSRIASVITASALAIMGTGFAAPVAIGQEATPTPTGEVGAETTPSATQNADRIDPNATVTLNIHKKLGDPTSADEAAGLPGLEGATFEIGRVADVDLTTQAGQAQASRLGGLDQAEIAGLTVENVVEVKTDANGEANFEGPIGLYRVTERNNQGYTTAPAFLIALPYANSDGNWTYTRDVYPKNQQIIPSKQVDDNGVTLGEDLTYTINAPVPAGTLSRFNIVDPLISALTLKPEGIEVATSPVGAVSFDDGDYTVTTNDNTLRVDFSEAGREKLQEARKGNPDLKVTVKFNATVNSIPANGQITNTATIELPNGAFVNTDGPDPNNPEGGDQPTSTTFGNLTITKTSQNGDSTLNGAEFELYLCQAEEDGTYTSLGEALPVATTETGNVLNKLTTSGGNDSGGDATANGYAIPMTSFAAGTGAVENQYCVLETKAPRNYARNPELQPVNADIENLALTVSVDNRKDTIAGMLPATGAWGILLVFLVGLLLLARGIYTSYKDSRATA